MASCLQLYVSECLSEWFDLVYDHPYLMFTVWSISIPVGILKVLHDSFCISKQQLMNIVYRLVTVYVSLLKLNYADSMGRQKYF